MDLSIETILRPDAKDARYSFAGNISDAVYEANLAYAKSGAHIEAAFRRIRGAFDRTAAGTPVGTDAAEAMIYPFVTCMGPLAVSTNSLFEAPKAPKAPKDDSIDVLHAIKLLVSLTAGAAVRNGAADIVAAVKTGKVTVDGETRVISAWDASLLADDGSNLIDYVLDSIGSADFRAVTGPEYAGRTEFMKGKTAQLAWGFYANPRRTGAKAKPEATTEAKPETVNGAAEAPAGA